MKPRYFYINISLHCIVYIIFMTFKNILQNECQTFFTTKMYNCNLKKDTFIIVYV